MKKVGFVQLEVEFGNRAKNLDAIERLVNSADGADLLVIPELATTGYEFRDRAEAAALAEEFGNGPASEFLMALSGKSGATLVMGYAERSGNSVFNSALVCGPDGMIGNYRKVHLYSRENEIFDKGDEPFKVFDTPAGRIGVMICFDWFFPEAARSLAIGGAQIIAHPSNLVLPWCQRAMFARSVENRVFSVTANRTGTEDRTGRTLTFTGGSQVLDIHGSTLASAGADGNAAVTVEIDPCQADNKQLNPHNNLLQDRRPDLYQF
jgi:predicted amidohydrolase